MITEPQFSNSVLQAAEAVTLAGEKLLRHIHNQHTVTYTVKIDSTLVLNIDLSLQEEILKFFPSENFVSEEMPDTYDYIGTPSNYFLIDPLDGTTSCKRFFSIRDTQVGFGPLVGVVTDGKVTGAAFFNCPARKLFVAEAGKGCWMQLLDLEDDLLKCEEVGGRLRAKFPGKVSECGVLFYTGLKGELPAVEKLKRADLVENFYRFGGFANDCSRLAQGFEQIQIQYTVKAWDLPAALLAAEAGLSVMVGTGSQIKSIYDWTVTENNPVCAAPPAFMDQVQRCIA